MALKHQRTELDFGLPAACEFPEGQGSYYYATGDPELCRACLLAFITRVKTHEPTKWVDFSSGELVTAAEMCRRIVAGLDPHDPLTVVLKRVTG